MRAASVMLCVLCGSGCSVLLSTHPRGLDHRCSSSPIPPIVDAVLVGASIATVGIVASTTDPRIKDNPFPMVADSISLSVAIPFTISAIYGLSLSRCPDDATLQAMARAEDARERAARDDAWRLREERTRQDPTLIKATQTAHTHALAKDCAVVRTIGDHVRALDREYFVRVFSLDPQIAACLASGR